MSVLGDFVRFLSPYRGWILVLFVGLTLESSFEVAARYSARLIIDEAIAPRDMRYLVTLVGLLGVGSVIYSAACIASDYLWARVGLLIINNVRHTLFDHVQRLPIGFFSRTSAGDLGERFMADAARLEEGMLYGVPMGVMGLFEILISLILMARMNSWLFALGAAGLAMSVVLPNAINVQALAASYDLRNKLGSLSGYVQQNIAAQTVVKAYGLEARATADFRQRTQSVFLAGLKSYFLSFLVHRIPSLLFLLISLALFGVGAAFAIHGDLSIGEIVAFQALFMGLRQGIGSFAWLVHSSIDSGAALERILEVMRESVEATPQNAPAMPAFSDTITFDRVSFKHACGTGGVEDVSFTIRKGQWTAIVGPSGAGKSTLLNLLLRFHDPERGRVTIDGADIRELDLASLRRKIAIVHQDVFVFDATLMENIRMGWLEAADSEVEAAAEAAQLGPLIRSLPKGYHTPCGEGGRQLSGGERQRLALARALVRRPEILILDEATAAIDSRNEAAFLQALAPLRGRCTIIAVTHRLAVARDADLVLVMSGGRVVEAGGHAELLAAEGRYAELWREAGRHVPG